MTTTASNHKDQHHKDKSRSQHLKDKSSYHKDKSRSQHLKDKSLYHKDICIRMF